MFLLGAARRVQGLLLRGQLRCQSLRFLPSDLETGLALRGGVFGFLPALP